MLTYHDNSGASRSVWLAARLTGAQAGKNFSRGIRVPDRIIKGMSTSTSTHWTTETRWGFLLRSVGWASDVGLPSGSSTWGDLGQRQGVNVVDRPGWESTGCRLGCCHC